MPPFITRRPWLRGDLYFLQQDTIRILLYEFGAVGPLLIHEVLCQTKIADQAGNRPRGERGVLACRASSLAMTLNTSPDAVCAILRRSEDIGLVELLPGTDLTAGRLRVRSLKRDGWEPKDATGAQRQQAARARRDAG